ncbi:MAG: aminotransferase, partial [Candidatus Magasanikbacteria bacterium]|nr:aminotransferase [Candidatus Magasanikbacteria bacterium]
PDLGCFGKAISGGFPLSVLCGRAEFMRRMDEVFVSTTFGGYTLGLAAAMVTIKMMREYGDVHQHLHSLGNHLIDQANIIAAASGLPINFSGYGPHPVMKVNLPDLDSRVMKTYIYQEMANRGILFSSSILVGYCHKSEMIDEVLNVFQDICAKLKELKTTEVIRKVLRGEVIAPRTVRNS